MARRSSIPLQKCLVRLRQGDYDFLNQAYPQLSAAVAIRHIIMAQVDALRASAEAAVPADHINLEVKELPDEGDVLGQGD